MTPLPATLIPGFLIWPVLLFTNGLPGLPGSSFGTTHGFTHRGTTGIASPPETMLPELDGLKTSAAAVALGVLLECDHIRENSVGRGELCTSTVTVGLMAKAVPSVEQSAAPPVAPCAENITLVTVGAAPPTALACATATAVRYAKLELPPQIDCHEAVSVVGSAALVIPDTEITRAAASAAVSAARCASRCARYSVTTSIDSAAIAIIATMHTATRSMVTPRSLDIRCSRPPRSINGFLMS